MIDLPYYLVIEATKEPDFFGFNFPDLEDRKLKQAYSRLYMNFA